MKTKTIFSAVLMIALLASFSSCRKKGCTDPNSLSYNPEAKKDDGSCTTPTAIKKSLVFKKTATWCPYCGDWGATYSSNLAAAYSNCQVIELHGDMQMETAVGDALMDALPSAGWPHFYLGMEDLPNSYSQISNSVSTQLGEAVEVSMAMEKTTTGSTMNVRVQSQWLGSTSGEYFLAVYVLENGIVATQQIDGAPSDPNFVHNYVLRGEASNSAFGKAITINGEGYLEEFDIALGSGMVAANCYPVAVMWKRNGSTYDFVNFVK